MKEKWMLRQNTVPVKEFAAKLGINETTVSILANRGLNTLEEMKRFMKASLEDLHDPFLMKDMDKGTEIIKEAILNNKNIVIYGDYDADGVTSTTVLFKALTRCKAKVEYYVPDREQEGYGINSERLEKLKLEGAEVILTCDNGISAIEQVEYGKNLGLTIVITDHHEVPFVEDDFGNRTELLPKADAIINPKQKDCRYPFKLLCGAGIAYKFSEVLYKKMNVNQDLLEEILEFAGIGTICDVVDLVEENRIIAKNALVLINKTKNLGLKTLIEVLGMKDKKIGSGTIGFQIGPCINATGRLETAALSVELMLTENTERALELATILKDLNQKRQSITIKNVEEIIESIEKSPMRDDKVLVIYKEDVHESIAGIVAGKVKDKFNVPTIVITKGKDMPKGSGRSIEEYNLFEELIKCKDLIYKFGGHPMAAGLSIKEENISLLRNALNSNCTLTKEDITPKIRIDKRVLLSNLSFDLINELEVLEPFGKGNESPLLAEKNIKVDRISIIGKDSKVLKLSLVLDKLGRKIDALSFGKAEEFKEMLKDAYGEAYSNILNNPKDIKLDIIFSPFINEYNGNTSVQIRLCSFRLSE